MKTLNVNLNGVETSINLLVKGVDTIPEDIKSYPIVKSFLSANQRWMAIYIAENPTPLDKKMKVTIVVSENYNKQFNYHEFARKCSNTIIRHARRGLGTIKQQKAAKGLESFYRSLVFDKIESELLEEYTIERIH